MKHNRHSVTAFLAMLFLTFISCDPSGRYEYWIDNKSDTEIFVVLSENSTDYIEHISSDPNSLILLKRYETINGLHDYRKEFLLRFFDSLAIMTDTTIGSVIKKNYSQRSSWQYDQKNIKHVGLVKSGDNVYILEITNEDLK